MKRTLALLLALALSVTPILAAGSVAYPSAQQVNVDGAAVEFQMYALKDENGNDTNYVKVRDVAYALNGTAAQFSVGWDGAVNLVPGQSYEANGSEMSTPFSGERAYTAATAPTNINGQAAQLDAIVLTDDAGGGYTYYKLRDLGAALGFTVDWSAETGVFIQTAAQAPAAPAIPTYASYPDIPDFGALLGVKVHLSSDGIYAYDYDAIIASGHKEDYLDRYNEALAASGFAYSGSFDNDEGSKVLIHKNSATGRTLTVSPEIVGNAACVVVMVMSPAPAAPAIPTYASYPDIPDFGALLGVKVHLSSDGIYAYDYDAIIAAGHKEDYLDRYDQALEASGFTYSGSFDSDEGSTVLIYKNSATGRTLTVSPELVGNAACVVVMVMTSN